MDMIFPNGEFRITNPEYKGFGGRKPLDDKVSKFTLEATDQELDTDNASYMGLSNALICHNSSEGEAFVSEQPNSEVETKPTEIKVEAPGAEVNNSSSTKSRSSAQTTKKRRRKGNPMTAYTKRVVKSAAYLLEKEVGKENLAFVTMTLPTLSDEELKICNQNFPELSRQLCQWVSRRLEKKGLSKEYVAVTEVQSQRYKESGQLALHAHLVFQSRENRYSKNWAITKEEIRTIWEGLLSNLLNRSVEAPYATRIERVKKSVSKYLGKYLSKGGEILEKIAQDNRTDELPPKWDRMSKSLREKVKALIKVPSDYTKRFIANNLESLKENGILLWYHIIEHDFGQYDWFDKRDKCPVKIVGYCGEFTTEEYMNQFIKMERPEYDYILT